MARKWRRSLPNLIFVVLGLLLVGAPGLWLFLRNTAPVLHPNPQDVPSVMDSVVLPQSADAVGRARQIVRARISAENLPGLSVAVGVGGELAWAEGFGFADLKTRTPVKPSHRFRIGTASAAVTSVAVGLLVEDGRLKLDQEIQSYVPAFPQKQWPLTLRHLMGHTAGINPNGGEDGPMVTKHCGRPLEALEYFARNPLQFEPGTQYRFSNYDGILVSAAVEAAANQPFLTFMQDRVFGPLGMRDTVSEPKPAEVDDDHPLFNLIRERIYDPRTTRSRTTDFTMTQDRLTYYFPRFASDPNHGLHLMRPLDVSCYAGGSGFISTPSDLVRLGMAMDSGRLLQPATVHTLQTSQKLASGKDTGYGLGWDLATASVGGRPTRVVGHNGELLGGMAATLMTFPERGIVVSVVSNIPHAETFDLAVKLAEAFAATH